MVAAACLAGVIVAAGLGAWLLSQNRTGGSPAMLDIEFVRKPSTELTFVVSYMDPHADGAVPWGDLWMRLVARPTDNASYTYRYWEWHPNTDLLTSQNGTVVQSMNSSRTGSTWQIVCNLTDIAGNGCANTGDFFVLSVVGSEAGAEGVPLEIMVFEGGTQVWTMHFQIGVEGENPRDLVSTILNDPLIMGAVLVVILVVSLVLIFARRRRKSSAPVEREVEEAQPPPAPVESKGDEPQSPGPPPTKPS
jgi:hypothetical protein